MPFFFVTGHRKRITWLNVADRFWLSVAKTDNCWEWQGRKQKDGYGQVTIDGRRMPAHRLAWALANGPIAEGMFVCHHCDNRGCVRPDHLFLGTSYDNVADMVTKGRQPRGTRNALARLTEGLVIRVREDYATGQFSQQMLGARYGVHQGTIAAIVRRKTWRHVGGPEAPIGGFNNWGSPTSG